MPDDETMDYLITRAIADYLAVESMVKFDGIMYPSVQSDKKGINIVLFHKSSRVKPYPWELDVSLGAYTDEGWEWDYHVLEKKRNSTAVVRQYYDDLMDRDIFITADKEKRQSTLSIDTASIRIHHIMEVRFIKESHDFSCIDDSPND